ncbi:hypothetical protein EWM64_g4930 [Hericium alpestre]|uniref:Cytochrome P450 n=1 Tax=Hericium alpestre TaxID=135208 RepID=A0A4Y9ZW86_9AGAM|nr:hypothetical protein EWM64_g4930 [Hericium alpestre]
MPSLVFDVAALVIGLAFASFVYDRRRKRSPHAHLPFPPGPKGLPLIGNLLDLPKSNEWEVYDKWSKEFDSGLIHLNVCGTHIFIVNSAEVANDLFEKRSALYSDRPAFPAQTKLLEFDWVLDFQPYGPRWRAMRKMFHEQFHPTATTQWYPLQAKATHKFLQRLLETPDQLDANVRHMAGEIILAIAYGIDVKPHNDPYVVTAEKSLRALAIGSTIGIIYDLLPILTYLPEWFPGSFKKEAKKWLPYNKAMVENPYRFVREALENGTAPPSVAAAAIGKLKHGLDESIAKNVPANMYFAAADTTVSATETFFLAMTLYPEAQKKAQAEIDAVIGNDRLPDFSDQDSLPYVEALVKEVMRWRLVVPTAVPHRVTTDDVYNGYFIPAGSTIIGNGWGILRDEKTFPEPEKFMPEHFLDTPVKYPDAAFGFGRRICPGRHFGHASARPKLCGAGISIQIRPSVKEVVEGKIFVDGTIRVLEYARKAMTKKIVVTSKNDWYYQTLEDAMQPGTHLFVVYSASKALAEKVVWDFAKQHPEIDIASVHAGSVYDPTGHG